MPPQFLMFDDVNSILDLVKKGVEERDETIKKLVERENQWMKKVMSLELQIKQLKDKLKGN